jgi:hypothetical protein
MTNNCSNEDNEFLKFLETGKDVSNAVKPRKAVDTQGLLRAKYPDKRIPNANRIVKRISDKQRKAIKHQEER